MYRDANKATEDYFDRILFEERLIGSVKADTGTEFFGEHFDTPVMTPAFSHMGDGLIAYSEAMKELNGLNWVGMGETEELSRILSTGARTVKIVKPYADRDKVLSQIEFARDGGCIAVGMDIDHIFGPDGDYDLCVGERMAPQTLEDIKEYAALARIPFVIKGVLSVRDAALCAEAGVKGIVVSHHHGRLPYAIPPLMVLPEISKEVGSSMTVFADCGVGTGADVFKCLALGANGAAVGRAFMGPLKEKGREGACEYIDSMTSELRYIMGFTGCRTVADIGPDILRFI